MVKGPYTNSTRLAYLLSLVKGPPLKLIENYKISDDNFNLAY